MTGRDIRRFVVLEHQHEGVHWDVMIEDGTALRTWAVDAPIIPDVDLPARELPAHRRIYLDYEGAISGGRGTVRRWDCGACVVREWGEARVVVEASGVQLVGRVELRRAGTVPARDWLFRFGKLS